MVSDLHRFRYMFNVCVSKLLLQIVVFCFMSAVADSTGLCLRLQILLSICCCRFSVLLLCISVVLCSLHFQAFPKVCSPCLDCAACHYTCAVNWMFLLMRCWRGVVQSCGCTPVSDPSLQLHWGEKRTNTFVVHQ